ncbi:MAG TPA: ABC transporter permease [Candidatus Caldiarchaeum subterraneum]|uniref:ABC transporter permease n=1 Tax=Caldiarchaeum subterraneum TaxID=311458 RepID=A0A832ZVL4_CALS0|nr:ABC transporter permease [Candidatus Caldarchaeum subterraneum]
MKRRLSIYHIYAIPTTAYLLLFFYIPIITIIVYSFWIGGPFYEFKPGFTLENYVRFLTSRVTQNVMIVTNVVAFLSFLATLLVAYPIAYFLARVLKGDTGLRIILLMLIPLEMNYLIRIFAWRNILGEQGFINNLLLTLGIIDEPVRIFFHSMYAVIIVIVHNALPYAVFPLYITLRSIPQNLYQAAMDLGSNRVSTFFRVTLPLSMPGIAVAFLFIYVPMLGEFAIPALVGGKTFLLGNLITRQYLDVGNWPYASAATISLLIITLIASFLVFKYMGVRRLYE